MSKGEKGKKEEGPTLGQMVSCEELRKKFAKVLLQRYKGLGEMNVTNYGKQLRIQKLHHPCHNRRPSTRTCRAMGDKVEPRRKWIEDNVKFTLEE